MFEALFELRRRIVVQFLAGQRNVRLALARVVVRQLPESDFRTGTGQADHFFSQFEDRKFMRVAQVDRCLLYTSLVHFCDVASQRIAQPHEADQLQDDAQDFGIHLFVLFCRAGFAVSYRSGIYGLTEFFGGAAVRIFRALPVHKSDR